MKQLTVPFISALNENSSLEEIAVLLDATEKHAIDLLPWPDGAPAPEVFFRIAHNDRAVFLRYFVKETFVKAGYLQPNDPVYRDSCVEFFLDVTGDGTYYNFEFNCIGACLSAYGPANRAERRYRPAGEIAAIRRGTLLRTERGAYWELTAVIPAALLHGVSALSGLAARGNFYKCGDDLPHPHYLAWNNIETAKPDFHQPRFFGTLLFATA